MTATSAKPQKKRSIGKIIGVILGVLVLLIIVGFFVATSSAFFKKIILPRVGATMNSAITVDDAQISPFSQVVLTKLQVIPIGKETLFKADEIRAHYSLMDILRGKITVQEATITSPTITIVEASDGSSNLDSFTKQKENEKVTAVQSKEKKEKKSEKPLNLNIQNVSLKNAFVQKIKNLSGGGRETVEISNLNFSIDRLSNGQSGKLAITADVRTENVPAPNSTNSELGSMRANLAGNFDYKLTQDILPESTKGNLRLNVSEATGQMADLAKLAAILDCDLTPNDIHQVKLHFEQNGNALGEVRVSGPFSVANMEGKLKVEVSSIDRRVLNLVGAASGIDFNSTIISSASDIVISQKGNAISVNGQLNANQLSVTKKAEKQTTPVMDLQAAYQINVDAKSALIQKLDLNGTQNGQKILSASLSKPMLISLGGTSDAPENATLQLSIHDLNLADWQSFAGDVAPSGKLNTTLNILSQQAGKQLSLNVTSRIDNLSATFGGSQISQNVELRGQADIAMREMFFDLKQLQISFSPTARAKNQLNITGQLDLSKTNAIKGKLQVQSDALDVTPFYDLYSGKPSAKTAVNTKTPSPKIPQTSPAPSNQEPEPIKLPIEQMIAEINIGQFYLREIEIKDWRGTAKIEGSRVLLNPFQLSLNGAPVKFEADLNLGVKGYAYTIRSSLDKVPIEPLANTLMSEKRGAYRGTVIANADIKGAGTTGASLKKSLDGRADFTFTNANIEVVGKHLKPALTTIGLLLNTPELTASPINWVAANLKLGEGKIDLQNFQMQSDAFAADMKGIIPIADVLTNSPLRKLPLNFGLSYALAKRAHLTSANTPTNSPYVMLPQGYLTVRGTLGDPKVDPDETKILGTALENFSGKIPGVDEKTSNLIKGLGGLLSGKPAQNPTNEAATTNQLTGTNNSVAPQTNSNEQLINGVLDLFNKKKKK